LCCGEAANDGILLDNLDSNNNVDRGVGWRANPAQPPDLAVASASTDYGPCGFVSLNPRRYAAPPSGCPILRNR
jgi:hypothetical protein